MWPWWPTNWRPRRPVLAASRRRSVAGAARALHAAQRIWIAGFRSCRSVAELLNYQLRLFRPDDVQLVGGSGPEDLDLGAFHQGDAVVVIGFAPYSTASVLSARAAHQSGATLVAIADTMTAPMAEGAEHLLLFEVGVLAGILPEPDRARSPSRSRLPRSPLRWAARPPNGGSRKPKSASPRCRNMLPRKVETMAGQKSRVLHRSLREAPPKAVGGEGVWLIAEDGRRILDGSGGAAVSCLGHQHPRVIEAMTQAGVEARLCPYRLLLVGAGGSAGRKSGRRRAGRARLRLFRQRRIGSDRGQHQAGAAIFHRAWRAEARSTSSPAARAITAIRWARSPPAATPGAASPMRRCCRPPSAT